jgi:hypothetical protein
VEHLSSLPEGTEEEVVSVPLIQEGTIRKGFSQRASYTTFGIISSLSVVSGRVWLSM